MSASDFVKSPEGDKAFADIDQPYPEWQWGTLYEEYLKNTSADPKLMAEHGEGHHLIEINKIIRKKTAEGPEGP